MSLPTDLTHRCYHNDEAARIVFEAIQWPDGPVCPFCGLIETVSPLGGKSMGPGWYWCAQCREKFTVRVGSVMERSHIALHKWLLAFRLMNASKKGMSAHQLHRMLGIGYRAAWFMAHRIRLAQDDKTGTPMGGAGKVIEADETFIGGREANKHKSKRTVKGGTAGKEAVFTLVERGGRVRSHHVPDVTGATLRPILVGQTHRSSTLMTDRARRYVEVGREFAGHKSVDHDLEEYVRGDAHINSVEGYFSILKRGIIGTYHHVSAAHLHRYLSEFDFRHSNRVKLGIDDTERAHRAIRGATGKRLHYRQPSGQAHP